MVGHRSAVDTELPSELVQRTAVLVGGGYGFKLRRGQSTLDRFCRSSSSTVCGGGVDTIDVGAERPGAGVWMLSPIVRTTDCWALRGPS